MSCIVNFSPRVSEEDRLFMVLLMYIQKGWREECDMDVYRDAFVYCLGSGDFIWCRRSPPV